jgi:hypothetical protein
MTVFHASKKVLPERNSPMADNEIQVRGYSLRKRHHNLIAKEKARRNLTSGSEALRQMLDEWVELRKAALLPTATPIAGK